MKATTISINQSHIDNAEQQDACKCMISLALKERGAKHVKITAENIRFNLDGKSYMALTPLTAAKNLVKFDRSKNSVKPFKFSLGMLFSQPIKKQKRYGTYKPSHTRSTKGKKRPTRSNKRIAGLRKVL